SVASSVTSHTFTVNDADPHTFGVVARTASGNSSPGTVSASAPACAFNVTCSSPTAGPLVDQNVVWNSNVTSAFPLGSYAYSWTMAGGLPASGTGASVTNKYSETGVKTVSVTATSDVGGTSSNSCSNTVGGSAATASCTITRNPAGQLIGGNVYILDWSSVNVDSCTLFYSTDGGSTFTAINPSTSGSQATTAIAPDQTWFVSCFASAGFSPAVPTCSLNVKPIPQTPAISASTSCDTTTGKVRIDTFIDQQVNSLADSYELYKDGTLDRTFANSIGNLAGQFTPSFPDLALNTLYNISTRAKNVNGYSGTVSTTITTPATCSITSTTGNIRVNWKTSDISSINTNIYYDLTADGLASFVNQSSGSKTYNSLPEGAVHSIGIISKTGYSLGYGICTKAIGTTNCGSPAVYDIGSGTLTAANATTGVVVTVPSGQVRIVELTYVPSASAYDVTLVVVGGDKGYIANSTNPPNTGCDSLTSAYDDCSINNVAKDDFVTILSFPNAASHLVSWTATNALGAVPVTDLINCNDPTQNLCGVKITSNTTITATFAAGAPPVPPPTVHINGTTNYFCTPGPCQIGSCDSNFPGVCMSDLNRDFMLQWTTTESPTSCTPSVTDNNGIAYSDAPDWLNIFNGADLTGGMRNFNVNFTKTPLNFNLTCTNAGGSATASVRLSINGIVPVAKPTVILLSRADSSQTFQPHSLSNPLEINYLGMVQMRWTTTDMTATNSTGLCEPTIAFGTDSSGQWNTTYVDGLTVNNLTLLHDKDISPDVPMASPTVGYRLTCSNSCTTPPCTGEGTTYVHVNNIPNPGFALSARPSVINMVTNNNPKAEAKTTIILNPGAGFVDTVDLEAPIGDVINGVPVVYTFNSPSMALDGSVSNPERTLVMTIKSGDPTKALPDVTNHTVTIKGTARVIKEAGVFMFRTAVIDLNIRAVNPTFQEF
ncbi:MAG: hypothetical protein WCT19_02650, partial [Candidatus Paceibacterota bacterium]